MEWFECKVRYDKTLETGAIKKVTEPYLVDALSFTEAERRFTEEISPFMTGDWKVEDIKRCKFAELIETDEETADRYYKAKVAFITIDDKSGTEKRSNQTIYVQASDLRDAAKRLDASMGTTMIDYDLLSIAETQIMDVFHYEKKNEAEQQ